MQQVVSVQLVQVPGSGQASIPIANLTYKRPYPGANPDLQPPSPLETFGSFSGNHSSSRSIEPSSPNITFAIESGLFGGGAVDFNVISRCESVNCSWPLYDSLIFQSHVRNVTDQLEINKNLDSMWSFIKQRHFQHNYTIDHLLSDEGQYLQSVPIFSLPNGYNVSVRDGMELILKPQRSKIPIFPDFVQYDSLSTGTANFVCTSLIHRSLFTEENSASIMVMHILEFSLNWTGYHFSLQGVRAYESSLDLQGQTFQAMTSLGVHTETSIAEPVIGVAVANRTSTCRDVAVQRAKSEICDARYEPRRPTPSTYPVDSFDFVAHCVGQVDEKGHIRSNLMMAVSEPVVKMKNRTLSMDPFGVIQLAYSLIQLLSSNMTSLTSVEALPLIDPSTTSPMLHFETSNVLTLIGLALLMHDPKFDSRVNQRSPTLEDIMSNMARSLTQYMRVNSKLYQTGIAYQTTAIFKVQWGWIGIPVFLVASVALLMVFVVFDTKRKCMPVWKDSSIVTMLHGITEGERQELLRMEKTKTYWAAQDIEVFLQGDHLVLGKSETLAEAIKREVVVHNVGVLPSERLGLMDTRPRERISDVVSR